MKHLTLILALCLCLSIPSQALTFFETDYDGDTFTETVVTEEDWLPLRELSSILPYEVEWKDNCVYIYSDRTHKIDPSWWIPPDVKIQNGVTYVSPRYMKTIIPDGISFMYDGELYVFNGETVTSELIRGDEDFREHVLTSMYWIKKALPEDYNHIRECITGGIKEVARKDAPSYKALAYIYPQVRKPVAHIVASKVCGSWLAELIAHEAHHVHLTRQGRDSEKKAQEYGKEVASKLLELTKSP